MQTKFENRIYDSVPILFTVGNSQQVLLLGFTVFFYYKSVYLVALPQTFSTGYFAAFFSIFQ